MNNNVLLAYVSFLLFLYARESSYIPTPCKMTLFCFCQSHGNSCRVCKSYKHENTTYWLKYTPCIRYFQITSIISGWANVYDESCRAEPVQTSPKGSILLRWLHKSRIDGQFWQFVECSRFIARSTSRIVPPTFSARCFAVEQLEK